MGLQLEGTAACTMRDKLISAKFKGEITCKEITERLYNIEIPEWLEAQILQMVQYRWTERITCPIELAMEKAVHRKIVDRIIKEERNEIA